MKYVAKVNFRASKELRFKAGECVSADSETIKMLLEGDLIEVVDGDGPTESANTTLEEAQESLEEAREQQAPKKRGRPKKG